METNRSRGINMDNWTPAQYAEYYEGYRQWKIRAGIIDKAADKQEEENK